MADEVQFVTTEQLPLNFLASLKTNSRGQRYGNEKIRPNLLPL